MVQNTHVQVIGGANLSYAPFSHVNDYTQDVFINTLLLSLPNYFWPYFLENFQN